MPADMSVSVKTLVRWAIQVLALCVAYDICGWAGVSLFALVFIDTWLLRSESSNLVRQAIDIFKMSQEDEDEASEKETENEKTKVA